MNEFRVLIAADLCEHARALGVDAKGFLAMRFAIIDIGQRGAINYKIDIERADLVAELPRVSEV